MAAAAAENRLQWRAGGSSGAAAAGGEPTAGLSAPSRTTTGPRRLRGQGQGLHDAPRRGPFRLPRRMHEGRRLVGRTAVGHGTATCSLGVALLPACVRGPWVVPHSPYLYTHAAVWAGSIVCRAELGGNRSWSRFTSAWRGVGQLGHGRKSGHALRPGPHCFGDQVTLTNGHGHLTISLRRPAPTAGHATR